MGEYKQIQEILSKIGTEFFKIDEEEMAEKNVIELETKVREVFTVLGEGPY